MRARTHTDPGLIQCIRIQRSSLQRDAVDGVIARSKKYTIVYSFSFLQGFDPRGVWVITGFRIMTGL